jgi:RIO kinase 1
VRDEHDLFDTPRRRGGKRRFDDDDRGFADKRRALATPLQLERVDELPDGVTLFDGLSEELEPGTRWSTWDGATHGPTPRPDWVITDLAAVDAELGVLKTGKEADVHLVLRSLPGTERSSLMAAKRYRSNQHRMFHRDSGYVEGRRVKKSREQRAMVKRTAFGREVLAAQWAVAEFAALGRLWSIGVPVPYPVQLAGTELLLEFVGTPDGEAAPRLAQLRPPGWQLRALWTQLLDALVALAAEGLTHGDLSPYNVLVHEDRLVLIDLPQVVDVVANPRGVEFLRRDVAVMTKWFAARGLAPEIADTGRTVELLLSEAGML